MGWRVQDWGQPEINLLVILMMAQLDILRLQTPKEREATQRDKQRLQAEGNLKGKPCSNILALPKGGEGV